MEANEECERRPRKTWPATGVGQHWQWVVGRRWWVGQVQVLGVSGLVWKRIGRGGGGYLTKEAQGAKVKRFQGCRRVRGNKKLSTRCEHHCALVCLEVRSSPGGLDGRGMDGWRQSGRHEQKEDEDNEEEKEGSCVRCRAVELSWLAVSFR